MALVCPLQNHVTASFFVSLTENRWAALAALLWPGLCLTVTIYSLNMFGDAVRDLLDPRLRGETAHDH